MNSAANSPAESLPARNFIGPPAREFLLYVVDRKLAGCPGDVTEPLIGHRVYGRPASYDAGNDSIVRTEARTLRKRLERYFDGQAIDERYDRIPRGGYLPVFRQVEPSPPPVPAPPPQTSNQPFRRQWIWLGASAVTGAAVMFGWRNSPLHRTADGAPNRTPGIVQLESSDAELNVSFQRAKQRALSCAHRTPRWRVVRHPPRRREQRLRHA